MCGGGGGNPGHDNHNDSAATKMKKVKKKQAPLNDWKALGAHFGGPKLPKRGPRASPNLLKSSQKCEKIEVEKQVVFRFDFSMVWRWFLMVFWMIFASQKLLKLLKHNFRENLKIVIFPREN